MMRSLLLVLLCLSISSLHADEPKGKEEVKPQWQRLLSGEDAKKASQLTKEIATHQNEDNYREAIKTAELLLALRKEKQGGDHWQCKEVESNLTVLRKIAELSEEQRQAWRKATADDAGASTLEAQGKYREALPLRQQLLRMQLKVLGEEHPNTAVSYNKAALNLNAQGKYAEAAPLFQKALDISRKVHGEEHPDTAGSYNNVAFNLQSQSKYAESEPLIQKALDIYRKIHGEEHQDTAAGYNNMSFNLHAQAKYAEAAPLFQKALDSYRKVYGEEHSVTAGIYNNVAYNLHAQAKYAEAAPLFQKALDIRRKLLGEEHAATARCYNSVAFNLQAQGKYAEAASLYEKALNVRCKVLGEEHPDTPSSYNNVAFNLNAQGKYAAAASLYRRALDILRRVVGEDHPDTATGYNNLASNLDDQGKYAEAAPLYKKALDIRRKVFGEEHPDTAGSYNNVAVNLQAQAKYVEAAPLSQKALDIYRKIHGEEHPNTAQSYNNVAVNLQAQGNYPDAAELYYKALNIRRKVLGEEHPDTANSYNNLGLNFNAQGKYPEAAPLFQQTLDIRRKVLGEEHSDTAGSYNNMASNLLSQGDDAGAKLMVERAVQAYEASRLRGAARVVERAVLRAETVSPYALLAAIHLRSQKGAEAWKAVESDSARTLLDASAQKRGFGLTDEAQIQQTTLQENIQRTQAQILYLVTKGKHTDQESKILDKLLAERETLEKKLSTLAIAVSQRELATSAQIQAVLPKDAALLLWLDIGKRGTDHQEHWGCVVRSQGSPIWERLPGSESEQQWTDEDRNLPFALVHALNKGSQTAEVSKLFTRLSAQRLTPMEKHLQGVKHLYVVGANWMAGVPVELLTDQYTISYIPSGSYLTKLKAKERPKTAGLLAVGDPIFAAEGKTKPATALPPGGLLIAQVAPSGQAAQARLTAGDVLLEYAGKEIKTLDDLKSQIQANLKEKVVQIKVWREVQRDATVREVQPGPLGVVLHQDPAPKAIAERRKNDELLAKVRDGEWKELPGTRVEVTRLAKLFGDSNLTVLVDSDAGEQKLDELRKLDKLKDYRYLHFATHGEGNNAVAYESALILAQDRLPKDLRPFDGRLSANEVLETWQLNAELVTLSSCESALGRRAGGDGLLGFAQAFLLSGSRSVCLSLWKVDDVATVLLMDRFYQNLSGKRPELKGKEMPKAEALREAKAWLRELSEEEALRLTAELTKGVVRGERGKEKDLPLLPEVPKNTEGKKGGKPYAHPRYWAAFILIGDPE